MRYKCEVNWNPVTVPGVKQRIIVMFWAPKVNSLRHTHRGHLTTLNLKIISWGSMPPDPPSFCVHPNVHTRVQVSVSQTNAILLPLGL